MGNTIFESLELFIESGTQLPYFIPNLLQKANLQLKSSDGGPGNESTVG